MSETGAHASPIGSAAPTAAGEQWFGHPRGLATLFVTEMWERFSYYGMRAILILYLTAPISSGGVGLSIARGASIYGWYTMSVWAMALPGGLAADRIFGHYGAVMIGGTIIALGHFTLAFSTASTFLLGLGMIVVGTGLLKPNVTTMVGFLYSASAHQRDAGFSLFYMGANSGAFVAPLVCGYLGQRVGWHWGFGAAGAGMTLGLMQYAHGRKYLRASSPDEPQQNSALLEASTFKLSAAEWKRLFVIVILFSFAVIFFAGSEQQGSTLNLFADRYTRLNLLGWQVPSSWFQALPPLFVVGFAPVFAWFWVWLGRHEPPSPVKFAGGLLLLAISFLLLVPAAHFAQTYGHRVSPWWLISVFLIQSLGELALSPVGLSLTAKLAPGRIRGMIVGFWFLSLAVADKVSGAVAGLFEEWPLSTVFLRIFLVVFAAFLILLLLIKPIRRLMGTVR